MAARRPDNLTRTATRRYSKDSDADGQDDRRTCCGASREHRFRVRNERPDEPLPLAVGRIDLSRGGRTLGSLNGTVVLEWRPAVQIVCIGDIDGRRPELHDDDPVDLHVPSLGLTAKALVIGIQEGDRCHVRVLLQRAQNDALPPAEQLKFYLVNFPPVRGERVRHRIGSAIQVSRDRLRMTAGPLVCTVDQIASASPGPAATGTGYFLTHVGLVERAGQPLTPDEARELLDVLYWFFAFLRGARTGPVLPSYGSPFSKHWIAVEQWAIGDPRQVHTWLPTRSPLHIDDVFAGFIDRWKDPVWNEGLRTTLAWYVAAVVSVNW